MRAINHDGNHIPTHGTEEAGSKRSGSNPEWLVVNHAKKKWASVWRPTATNSMSLEVSTTNLMYTMELYKSVTVIDEATVIGNTAPQENREVRDVGEAEYGTDVEELETDWSQKWILLEIVRNFLGTQFDHLQFRQGIRRNYHRHRDLITSSRR